MRPVARGLAVAIASFALVACSGGGTATQAPPSQAASADASDATAVCAPSAATATVNAEIKDFAFSPATLNAKVGDVVSWANADGAPHGVELDTLGTKCTESIAGQASGGAQFNVAGSYPFHCFVHPTMKGTIVVA